MRKEITQHTLISTPQEISIDKLRIVARVHQVFVRNTRSISTLFIGVHELALTAKRSFKLTQENYYVFTLIITEQPLFQKASREDVFTFQQRWLIEVTVWLVLIWKKKGVSQCFGITYYTTWKSDKGCGWVEQQFFFLVWYNWFGSDPLNERKVFLAPY